MDKRQRIINNLEKLGLSIKESEIYYELVKCPSSNGSKIAKKLGYPRTTVYDILAKLLSKGYILSLQEGEITSYVAINPELLLKRAKEEMDNATKILEKEFKEVDVNSLEAQFYNLNSEAGVIERISQMLSSSEKEVYINTNWDLRKFKDIFKILKKRGVRVILFSFKKVDYKDLGIEVYYRNEIKEEGTEGNKRILVVSDMKKAIIASNYSGTFNGTYSENKLLIYIVAEHIHNDIYIMKLAKNFKGNFWKEINLHSMQELSIQN
ncbi:MAG: TrmB family transcriptional regulator [Fusobacteriaceae bacterium]